MSKGSPTENRIVRWMCSVTPSDRCSQKILLGKLGIRSITEMMRCNRLRWFGHLEQKNVDNWVSKCRNIKVQGSRRRGRPRKTWQECINNDMKVKGLSKDRAMDRGAWSNCVLREKF